MLPPRPNPVVVPFRWSDIVVSKVGKELLIIGTDITQQELATPHIAADGSLTLAYGSEDCHPMLVCDRIYSITPNRKVTMAMAYPPHAPQCVNYLGAGASLARHDNQYFSLLQVEGDQEIVMGVSPKGWMTWATSSDGLNWQFLKAGGGRTTDPLQSLPVIYLPDFAGQTLSVGGSQIMPRFWHSAMVFNGTDFDVCIGYAGLAGLCATWWKISYDPANGGLGAVSRLNNGQYVAGGVIPEDDSWVFGAHWPDDAADPQEIVRMDDHTLFFYTPAAGAFDSPTPISWARFGQPPKLLDTSPIYKIWSDAKGNPAGNALSVYRSGPTTLSGWITVSPLPPPPSWPCPRQGLLEIELSLV